MFQRFVSFGVKQLFGGARRGQPVITALGAAVSIWGLFRRINRPEKPVYSRELKDGETLRIRAFRGDAVVGETEVER
jgi:hypothetical protein